MLYWMFIKHDTYVDLSLSRFHYSNSISKEIISVAIPGSIEQIIMSVINMFMNSVLVTISSTTVVAAFTASFSVVDLCMMTSVGIATATITVSGVAYGAHDYQKVKDTFYYSTKLSVGIAIILFVMLYVFTPQIATLFSYSSSSAGLNSIIVDILRILSIFLIVVPPGMCAAMVFQGMGKGLISLVLTLLREAVFVLGFLLLFVYIFNMGVDGVCYSLGAGSLLGTIIAVIVFELYMKRLKVSG
ncbi:MAG: hypothetical protein LUG89_01145 [Methanosphaera sp.]|nr:hypothetical protein [Methanosphaera sp.]